MFRSVKAYFLFFFVAFTSCLYRSEFPGYSQTDNGLYYKLVAIGDGKGKPKTGDYLQLLITYRTEKDSVFYDSYSNNETGKVLLPLGHSSFKGSFEEKLMDMNEGDSVSFMVNADSLFTKFFKSDVPYFIQKGKYVKLDVRLYRIFNEAEYCLEVKKFKELIENRDIEEQRKIQLFLDTASSNYASLTKGIYYQYITQGAGNKIERGNKIAIHYKGSFLNGKYFESSYERAQPLEFTYGEEQQVIKGIENAISIMNEGAKAKFIIPSQLAYGKSGSTNGIVPPYTTVIYEVEILKVN